MGVSSPIPDHGPENANTFFCSICIFCLDQFRLSGLSCSYPCGKDMCVSFLLPLLVAIRKKLDRQYAESSPPSFLAYQGCRDRNTCTLEREGLNSSTFCYSSVFDSENLHFFLFHTNPS